MPVSVTGGPARTAQGIFLVYDITDRRSFNHVHQWMRQIDQVRGVGRGRRRRRGGSPLR